MNKINTLKTFASSSSLQIIFRWPQLILYQPNKHLMKSEVDLMFLQRSSESYQFFKAFGFSDKTNSLASLYTWISCTVILNILFSTADALNKILFQSSSYLASSSCFLKTFNWISASNIISKLILQTTFKSNDMKRLLFSPII